MNTYHAFYKDKRIEVQSETSYGAQKVAAAQFKAKKSFEVDVHLVALAGKEVVHSTCELPGA